MKKTVLGGVAAVTVAGGIALAAPAGPAHADGPFAVCGPGYGVENNLTTCGFAANVQYAVAQHGIGPVYATSPANGQIYEMVCGHTSVTVYGTTWAGARCAGGNNAVVILW
jgi:hypothetical protein